MYIIFLFSTFFGILLCRLIILKQLKKKNFFLDNLCKTEGNFNCDAVLESPFSKLSKTIHLGDIGLFYFSAQFIFLLLSIINDLNDCLRLLMIPVICSFLGTIVLLMYQWKVIKSWCKLCLLLTSVIWFQAISLFIYSFVINSNLASSYFDDLLSGQTLPTFFTGITCLSIASSWFFAKPIIMKANEVEKTRKQIIRWKNSIYLFWSVLKSQKKIDPQLWDDDFILGNKESPIKLIVALNPYCLACAREYKQLMDLLTMHHDSICIAIRFGVNLSKPGNKNLVVQYLIHSYFNTPNDMQAGILTDWFAKTQFKALQIKYPDIDLKEIGTLKRYEQWFKDTEIKYTPTIFLNGYEFQSPYTVSDLKKLVPKLVKLNIKSLK